MSNDNHALALDGLRQVADHIEGLQRRIEELERAAALAPANGLVAELVQITRRAPSWHLGHLSAEEFEHVRERLGVAPTEVQFSDHENGSCYFIIQVRRDGLDIRAQRTAPPMSSTYSPRPTTDEAAA